MRNSTVNTVDVPIAGSKDPATLYIATETPLRIIVRNAGPTILILAHDSSPLSSQVSGFASKFQLPPGLSEVFVLAPKQGIYAVSIGGGGIATYAVSEALPEAMAAPVKGAS